jgi:ABC-type amino acid transport substrate-binding protein/ABC-type amino acid transport system permease subunit
MPTDCSQAADALARVQCTGMLRVGVRTKYPPFATSEDGAPSGFEIDLAQALATKIGATATFITVTPANRIAALGEGWVDLTMAAMGHTVQRDGQARFVRPHYYQSETLIAGRKSIALDGWEGLAGKTVCVSVGNSTNADLAGRGARLMLFDSAAALLEQLRSGGCSLVAQDNTFLAAPLAALPLAEANDVKFGFAPLPWGAAVAQNGGERLAEALGMAMRQMHASGALQELAARHGVDSAFLAAQRTLWSGTTCAADPAACLLPPRDNRLEATAMAPHISAFEQWLQEVADVKVTLVMFKTRVALDLFLSGVGYSLLLVTGAVAATFALSLAFGIGLGSRRRAVRWPCRAMVMTIQSTPIVLLMVFAGVLLGSTGLQTPLLSVAAACIVLGLLNGGNAGQAIAEAALTLQHDPDGQRPALWATVRRAKAQIVSFIVNATRGSPVASMLGVPELLAALTDIASFSSERVTTYTLVLVFYMVVVSIVVVTGEWWIRRLDAAGGVHA